MFSNKEVYSLLLSILILSFIFGYEDGREVFLLSAWISNMIILAAFVSFSLLIREIVRKWYARRYDIQTEYRLWTITRFWFNTESKVKEVTKSNLFSWKGLKEFPIGVFLALLLSIGTMGKVFWTGVGSVNYSFQRHERAGRKKINISEWEEAKIAMSASFSSLFLIIILSLVSNLLGVDLRTFIEVNFWILFFNMLPIPGLDGGTTFFKSKYLYAFSLVFILLSYFLLFLGALWSILLSLVIAVIVLSVYWFKENKK